MAGKKQRRVRRRLADALDARRNSYFLEPPTAYTFINSGAATFDCVLGGGWPLGRVSNIVGDRSSGKTLLAIEAMTNFARTFPKTAKSRYAETEQAFDDNYGAALGMPLDRVLKPKEPIETVEAFYDDLLWYLGQCKGAGLYVLDSLDALSDDVEVGSDINKDSYGTGKAKKMSQLFRKAIRKVEKKKCHLMVISQVRDNIGVSFGRKYKRSGGRALDFYASQIIYLAHMKEITHTRSKIKRPIGIDVRVKCTKNKIGLPFRTCDMPILFGYGIEDISASIDWLITNKQTQRTGISIKELKAIRNDAIHSNIDEPESLRADLAEYVMAGWKEVEGNFLPTRRKYE